MQEEDLKTLSQHPGLVAQHNENGSVHISGTVRFEKWQRIKLSLPNYPKLKNIQLFVLEHLEYKSLSNLQIETDWRLSHLFFQLSQILPADPMELEESKTSNIFDDILALHAPEKYRIQIDKQCKRVRFSEFADYNLHYLEIELPSYRLLDHSLPDCVHWSELFGKGTKSLADILLKFMKYIEDLTEFYESFVSIDELCHVVQPSPVTTKHNYRVFPLNDRVYLKLTISDPFASYSSRCFKIIGPTNEVARMRNTLGDGLCNWDSDLDIHKNLLRIFDICYFPMPPSDVSSSEQEEQHCNICYVYQLDSGEVPIVSCDNAKCVLKCHAFCLRQWFNTVLDGKTFLDVSFGLCPYCKAKLSTSFIALLE